VSQRLRNIPNVQIVYNQKEADLTLNLIGNEVKINDRSVGYVAFG
jgi:hypothetical protein